MDEDLLITLRDKLSSAADYLKNVEFRTFLERINKTDLQDDFNDNIMSSTVINLNLLNSVFRDCKGKMQKMEKKNIREIEGIREIDENCPPLNESFTSSELNIEDINMENDIDEIEASHNVSSSSSTISLPSSVLNQEISASLSPSKLHSLQCQKGYECNMNKSNSEEKLLFMNPNSILPSPKKVQTSRKAKVQTVVNHVNHLLLGNGEAGSSFENLGNHNMETEDSCDIPTIVSVRSEADSYNEESFQPLNIPINQEVITEENYGVPVAIKIEKLSDDETESSDAQMEAISRNKNKSAASKAGIKRSPLCEELKNKFIKLDVDSDGAKIPEQEYNLKNQPSDKNKTNDKKKKAKEITKSSGSRNFVIQLKKNNIKHDFKISKSITIRENSTEADLRKTEAKKDVKPDQKSESEPDMHVKDETKPLSIKGHRSHSCREYSESTFSQELTRMESEGNGAESSLMFMLERSRPICCERQFIKESFSCIKRLSPKKYLPHETLRQIFRQRSLVLYEIFRGYMINEVPLFTRDSSWNDDIKCCLAFLILEKCYSVKLEKSVPFVIEKRQTLPFEVSLVMPKDVDVMICLARDIEPNVQISFGAKILFNCPLSDGIYYAILSYYLANFHYEPEREKMMIAAEKLLFNWDYRWNADLTNRIIEKELWSQLLQK